MTFPISMHELDQNLGDLLPGWFVNRGSFPGPEWWILKPDSWIRRPGQKFNIDSTDPRSESLDRLHMCDERADESVGTRTSIDSATEQSPDRDSLCWHRAQKVSFLAP